MLTILNGPNYFAFKQELKKIINSYPPDTLSYNSIYIPKLSEDESLESFLYDALEKFVSIDIFNFEQSKLLCITFTEKPPIDTLRQAINMFKEFCTENKQVVIYLQYTLTKRDLKGLSKALTTPHEIIPIPDLNNFDEAKNFCIMSLNHYNIQLNPNEVDAIVQTITSASTSEVPLIKADGTKDKYKKVTIYRQYAIDSIMFKLYLYSLNSSVISYNEILNYLENDINAEDSAVIIDKLFTLNSTRELVDYLNTSFMSFDYPKYIGFSKLLFNKLQDYTAFKSSGSCNKYNKHLFYNCKFNIIDDIDLIVKLDLFINDISYNSNINSNTLKHLLIKHLRFN